LTQSDIDIREKDLMHAMALFLRGELNLSNTKQNDEQNIQVRLVFTEQVNTRDYGHRMILCPLMTHPNTDFFGPIPLLQGTAQQNKKITTALVVGSWYLEWNEYSIVVPKRCYHLVYKTICDKDWIVVQGPPLNITSHRLAKIICKWNGGEDKVLVYDRITCNAQHFVDEVLQELELDVSAFGPVEQVVHEVRQHGYKEIFTSTRKEN